MKFTKMQASGNDYIYVNCFTEKVEQPEKTARLMSDRHFGVGADGMVLILPSERADIRMRIFNHDGSEGRMAGNALRCVAKFAYENKLVEKTSFAIETVSGCKPVEIKVMGGRVDSVTINMGQPELDPSKIPMNASGDSFINRDVLVGGAKIKATAISMGNPHWVFFTDSIDELKLSEMGARFENHELFPERVNTEFCVVKDGVINVRVWERGNGETLACGTGACASLVAASLNGYTGRSAIVRQPGGEILVEWKDKDNCVYMTGGAEVVFCGEWNGKK